MKKTLVLYNLIPDELKGAIVDLTDKQFKELAPAHNYFVNGDDWDDAKVDATNMIDAAFCAKDCTHVEKDVEHWRGLFTELSLTDKPLDLTGIDHLILASFYL